MATYVLVHGGDRDASLWDEIAGYLRNQDHKVFCPSLTSVTKATLQENIAEVIEYIEAQKLDSFILVGHSYGGIVITGVTNQIPKQVSMLIYVDSALPEPGQSLADVAEEHNFNYKQYGASEETPDPAVISKIQYDPKKVFLRPKAYVFCLQSEFIQIIRPTYEKIKSSNDDWLYFCLDTEHGCMFTQPKELTVILSGLGFLKTRIEGAAATA